MIIELTLGIIAGITCGLIPGIHANTLSEIAPDSLIFIIAMLVSHAYLEAIPAIFLGAPSEDTVMSLLPGHRLLREGKGYEAVKLMLTGSSIALIIGIILIPAMLWFYPVAYPAVKPYVKYALTIVLILAVLREENKKWAITVIVLSGLLGIVALDNYDNALMPIFTGLFAIPGLILAGKENIPKQKITENIRITPLKTFGAIIASLFTTAIMTLFPALGPAQAAALIRSAIRFSPYTYLILIGGINTADFITSTTTLMSIGKARSGALTGLTINTTHLPTIIMTALISAGIAIIITLKLAKTAKNLERINYPLLSKAIIVLIMILALYLTGPYGLLILATAAAIGMIAPLTGTCRSNAMACLIVPLLLN